MTYGKTTLVSLLMTTLIACGGGGSGSVQEQNPIDIITPEIVSITPDNGTSQVSVLSDIEITFSEPVTEASVDQTEISLALANSRLNGPSAIAFSRSLSADGKTLTLSPYKTLLINSEYRLTLDQGLEHSTGGAVEASSTTFTTYQNQRTRTTVYEDSDLTVIDGYIDYTADGSSMEYSNPGNDGQWFTNDDNLSYETLKPKQPTNEEGQS